MCVLFFFWGFTVGRMLEHHYELICIPIYNSYIDQPKVFAGEGGWGWFPWGEICAVDLTTPPRFSYVYNEFYSVIPNLYAYIYIYIYIKYIWIYVNLDKHTYIYILGAANWRSFRTNLGCCIFEIFAILHSFEYDYIVKI